MLIYELAALGAATCWALTSLISAAPAGHLGAPAFNRLRQIFVAVLLAAATCQAFASLIMRPLMASGIDPFAASMLRVAIAATALTVMMQLPTPAIQQQNPLNTRAVMVTALSGFLALAVGMTLLLFALSGGNVGIVSSLSATSPVIILPLIWLRTGQRPSVGAWGGAAIVIVGMALIFTRSPGTRRWLRLSCCVHRRRRITMQWDTVFECVREISGTTSGMPRAIVLLRHEVVASTQLTATDKQELHDVLDRLQSANLYGRISLVGKLKEVLSRHEAFKARYAEFGLPRK